MDGRYLAFEGVGRSAPAYQTEVISIIYRVISVSGTSTYLTTYYTDKIEWKRYMELEDDLGLSWRWQCYILFFWAIDYLSLRASIGSTPTRYRDLRSYAQIIPSPGKKRSKPQNAITKSCAHKME
jgi:hypothetical protein